MIFAVAKKKDLFGMKQMQKLLVVQSAQPGTLCSIPDQCRHFTFLLSAAYNVCDSTH